MLNFGTPLSRAEMKQVKGGNCYECDSGVTFHCYTNWDCVVETANACGGQAGCVCYQVPEP